MWLCHGLATLTPFLSINNFFNPKIFSDKKTVDAKAAGLHPVRMGQGKQSRRENVQHVKVIKVLETELLRGHPLMTTHKFGDFSDPPTLSLYCLF